MCEGRHGLINFTLPHRKWLYWEKILRFSRKFVKFVCTTDSLGYTIPSIFFRNSGLLIYQCQQLLPSCTWPCLLLLLGDYSKLGVAEKRRMWIDGTTKSWSVVRDRITKCIYGGTGGDRDLLDWIQLMVVYWKVHKNSCMCIHLHWHVCILVFDSFLLNIPLGPVISFSSSGVSMCLLNGGARQGLSVISTTLNLISVWYIWPSWALSCSW